MTPKERFELQVKIVERAEELMLFDPHEERWVRLLDIGYADKQFNLRLDDFLNADDFDFVHDWNGIHRHMNRRTCKIEGYFVPRFASIDIEEGVIL